MLTTALSSLLARVAHKGALVIDDFAVAARQFVALANADLQMMTLFGGTPTDEELDKAARNAVRTFLKAYGGPAADKVGRPPQLAAIAGG
jgi:hypothetical protein